MLYDIGQGDSASTYQNPNFSDELQISLHLNFNSSCSIFTEESQGPSQPLSPLQPWKHYLNLLDLPKFLNNHLTSLDDEPLERVTASIPKMTENVRKKKEKKEKNPVYKKFQMQYKHNSCFRFKFPQALPLGRPIQPVHITVKTLSRPQY